VGSLSEASIMKLLHDGLDLSRQQVSAVMGKAFPVLDEGADTTEAYRLFLSAHDAVVITRNEHPQGILTRIDLIDYWLKD